MIPNARIAITVQDSSRVARLFRDLPGEIQRKELQGAIYAAARVIERAVRAAAPRGTEPTRKTRRVMTASVGSGRQRRKVRFTQPLVVAYDYGRLRQNISRYRARKGTVDGAFSSVSISRGAAFWGDFLERGTKRMRARPFFFRAVDSAKTAFYARLNIEMEKRVDRTVKRLAARGGR